MSETVTYSHTVRFFFLFMHISPYAYLLYASLHLSSPAHIKPRSLWSSPQGGPDILLQTDIYKPLTKILSL